MKDPSPTSSLENSPPDSVAVQNSDAAPCESKRGDASLSRWEGLLATWISRKRVAQPGAVYGLLLRRASHRPLYRRPEYWLAAFWTAIPLLALAGVSLSRLPFGFFLLAAVVAMPLWTGIQAYLCMRQMVDTGTLEELILTPLGVRQVVTDIHVFNARKSFLPFVVLWVAWVATVFANASGLTALSDLMWSVQMLNGMALMGGASHLGVRLALGTIRHEVVVRRGLAVARIGAVLAGGLLLLLAAVLSIVPTVILLVLTLAWFGLAVVLAIRWSRREARSPVIAVADEDAEILVALERRHERG